MSLTRRAFLAVAALLGFPRPAAPAAASRFAPALTDRYDPWLDIDPAALAANVAHVRRLTRNRPILAVVKNNAYGLGLTAVGPLLDRHAGIAGFAVVKGEEALTLRESGVTKPILLMGMCSDEEAVELVTRGVQLSVYTDAAVQRVTTLARRFQRPIDVQCYLDTGMGRMGRSYHTALPWLRDIAARGESNIHGTFMAFTEEATFDPEQLRRFRRFTHDARSAGLALGDLHAASSNGVFHLPDAHLDLVRPGIALYGAYPSRPDEERPMAALRAAFRLRARVVRVTQLREGDSVSYGRNYIATKPTWIATLPVGHVDGYPRRAVHGGQVLIGERLYPVIGAVSASHTIVEIGDTPSVQIGDVATLIGPDRPEIEPNRFAETVGVSVYDVLMHLNPGLPKREKG